MGFTMVTQFHFIEHGQELLSGSLGLQVGNHLGGRSKGWGMQQVQCISYSTFGKALPLYN